MDNDKKVKFVELTKMYTSNDVHNESFVKKTPKKKMYHGSSTELDTYTEEKTCEKDIEQNITDSYSRKDVSQKGKSEINTLADISLGNNCSMENENVLTKKPKKKKNHNKSSNLIHTNTNHDTEIFNRMYEEVNEQNINDPDYKKNVNQIIKSELNALSDITLENKCSMDNDNVVTKKPKKKKKHKTSLNSIEINNYNDADHRTYEKDNKHIINDPESAENITKIKMSEINALTTKKLKKKKKHNKSLNTTPVEVYEQNIIDSYSRKNVSRKRKSEINALADISLGDSCGIDNENVPTKKPKKKKNHDESLNSIEFNTNHDTNIQIIERTYEVVNDQNISNFDFGENVNRTIKSELNTSSENKCSMDYDNVAIQKPKKKKNHDKCLNSIQLNNNNDAVNDSDSTKNISQKKMSEINVTSTKTLKKKKNLNLIEFNTNHDTEIQIFERTYDEINDSYYGKNSNQITKPELKTSSDILSENKLIMDSHNVATKKPKKKKKHNKSLNSIELRKNNDASFRTNDKVNEHNINGFDSAENISLKRISELDTLAGISLGNYFSNDNENVSTKIPKKKNHNKSLNSIELKKNNDASFRANEKVNEHNINGFDSAENISLKRISELDTLAGISLGNDFSNDNENVPTKIPKKKKNHNKSINSIELKKNNDASFRPNEKVNEHNINGFDSAENISLKRISELDTLAGISLGNDFSNDNENVPTKIPKKKKNHNKSLNSIELKKNNDASFRANEKVNEHNINGFDSAENISLKRISELDTLAGISLGNDFSNDNENVPTKILKKKKNHNKSLNSIELKKNNDASFRANEKVNEHNINGFDSAENISLKRISELDTLAGISLGNDFSNDNENVPTKILKKKKNHNKSLNSIELKKNNDASFRANEKVNEHNINGFDSAENISLKRISELDTLAGISLGNDFSNDNENVPTKILKKKKNHNKSLNSIELNTNNDAHFKTFEKNNEPNLNDSDSYSTENISQKRMSEMNALPDISLGNDFNDENVPTKKPKKKRNHNKSLNLTHTNTKHGTEIFERMCEEVIEPNMNNSDTKALATASLEINYSLDNEHLATEESEKRKKHDKIANNLNMPMISQNQSRLKTLLNSMELNNFEESSTNNTNLNLKHFNLIKYLTNEDPSLKNHPNFKLINEQLSNKINLTINKKCEIKASDILLLKAIGKIILKKIVEKIDSAQDMKDLVIKLPPECMKNKIHFIETTLSRLPNKSKMDIIKKHNPLIKLRVFNKDEDNMIREYWSKFQKEYNISNILPFLSNGLETALSPTERLQFIRYISAGLPNRLLYSVFNRFNILFNEYQDKTCFSEEEDQLIIKVDQCDAIKNKFSVLSLILNRTRLQLYRRHEVLKNKHIKREKFMWDNQKRQELLTNILLETNTEHWTQLKNLTITKDILIKVAKNLGKNITYDKVRYQWNYLYTMLFCEEPILMSTFNLTVLELLEQINPKHWSDLNWIEITNKLYPGAKSKVICNFFHTWIDKKVPADIKKNVRDTLHYLKKHEVDKLITRINKHGEREFPRYKVEDYDLLVNIND